MPNAMQQFFSGEISVDQDAWHYRVYQWWQYHGGRNNWGYRENLCHYMRVILIWAPLFWLFKVPIYKSVRPWVVAATLLWTLAFWQIPGLRTLMVTFTVFWVAYYYLIFEKKKTERFFQRISPPFIWLWDHGLRSFLVWFFTKCMLKVVYPWSVTLVISLGLFSWWSVETFGLRDFLITVGIIAGAVVALILMLLLIIFIAVYVKPWWDDRMRKRRNKKPYRYSTPEPRRERGSSTLKVAAHYAMAKKRKICPFIRLPGERQMNW